MTLLFCFRTLKPSPQEREGYLLNAALLHVHCGQNGSGRRPVPRTAPDMMEPHDSRGVYENISPSLADVPFRLFGRAAACELFEVSPPCAWSPYIPEAGFQHAVCPVKLACRIDQKGPAKARIFDIGPGKKSSFKSDYYNLYIAPVEFVFELLQLQQVPPAGQSSQVPMKDHQKPRVTIIVKAVRFFPRIREAKADSGLPNQTTHKDPYLMTLNTTGPPKPYSLFTESNRLQGGSRRKLP